LAVDPVDGALNYVIALLLSPTVAEIPEKCIVRTLKVPPRELAQTCYYDDVRNGTANHGHGAGNSTRGLMFDRQSSAAKFRKKINLTGRYVRIPALNGYALSFLIFCFNFFVRKLHLKLATLIIN
jgi:hypothetical protein